MICTYKQNCFKWKWIEWVPLLGFFPFLFISCCSFFSWKFLHIVSHLIAVVVIKCPDKEQPQEEMGLFPLIIPLLWVGQDRNFRPLHHIYCQQQGEKNPYILHCLLVLSSNLHSRTIQDSLPRAWCFPSWLCIPISIMKTTPHPHSNGMLQSQHNAIFYWDSLPGCVKFKWKASYHVLRNSQVYEPR